MHSVQLEFNFCSISAMTMLLFSGARMINFQISVRLYDKIKIEINKYFDLRMKPKTILEKLREKGVSIIILLISEILYHS